MERNLNLVLSDELGPTSQMLNLILVQVVLVDAIQSLDVVVALLLEVGPVKVGDPTNLEAVCLCVFEGLGNRSRVPGDFLRHAADVHTSTAVS